MAISRRSSVLKSGEKKTITRVIITQSLLCLFIASMVTMVGPFHTTTYMPHTPASTEVIDELQSMSSNLFDNNQIEPEVQTILETRHNSEPLNAIVFDAGSTGTRFHLFTFTVNNQQNLELVDEKIVKIEPGLSSYADNVNGAVESIKPMIELALRIIPIERRSSTPLVVKATAGLRLLPDHKADAILLAIDQYLRKIENGFKLFPDSVSMLTGEDEGVFGWFTANFLFNSLYSTKKSSVALDLGGGSTQITFDPLESDTFVRSPKDHIVHRRVFGRPRNLYSHSYLGFGLRSSRKSILHKVLPKNATYKKDYVKVHHPCFVNVEKPFNWTFEGVTYEIAGVPGDCLAVARSHVTHNDDGVVIYGVPEVNRRTTKAISFFYSLGVYSGLINKTDGIGMMRVRDYYHIASIVCGNLFDISRKSRFELGKPKLDSLFKRNWGRFNGVNKDTRNILKENPFACLDASYIFSLLHTGYQFNVNHQITVMEKVKGVETSWALGAAASLVGEVE